LVGAPYSVIQIFLAADPHAVRMDSKLGLVFAIFAQAFQGASYPGGTG